MRLRCWERLGPHSVCSSRRHGRGQELGRVGLEHRGQALWTASLLGRGASPGSGGGGTLGRAGRVEDLGRGSFERCQSLKRPHSEEPPSGWDQQGSGLPTEQLRGKGSRLSWTVAPCGLPGALCHSRGACGPRIRAENRPHTSLCAKSWGWLDLGRRARSTQQHTRVPCTPGKASSPKQRVKSIRRAAAKERGAQEMTEAQR